MRKALRAVSAVLCLLLLAGIFGACSSGGAGDKAADGGAVSSVQKQEGDSANPGNAEPYTLKFLSHWAKDDQTTEGYIFSLLLDEYIKANPGFDYEYETVEQFDVPTKISILVASNDVPDIFSYEDGGALDSIVNLKAIINMDKDLPKLGITLDKLCTPGAINAKRILSNFDDIYSLPENMVMEGVWYNKTIFEKNGLSVPKTWGELETLCDSLLKAGILPFALGGQAKWPITRWIMLYANRLEGSSCHLDASRLENGSKFTDDVFVKAAAKTQEMFKKGYFGKGYNSLDYQTSVTMFLSGESAMIYNGSWFASSLMSKEENKVGEENIGYFQVPGIEGSRISLEDALKIDDLSTNMAICFGKTKFDEGTNNECLKYILSKLGKMQWEYGKFSPFISEPPKDFSPIQQIVMDELNYADSPCLWFEAKMDTSASNVALENGQLLAEGNMTPEQYCALLTDAINVSMAKK